MPLEMRALGALLARLHGRLLRVRDRVGRAAGEIFSALTRSFGTREVEPGGILLLAAHHKGGRRAKPEGFHGP
ncbi:MAG: hypothetical protein R2712_05290 [Vicinamibacterales bacterium]